MGRTPLASYLMLPCILSLQSFGQPNSLGPGNATYCADDTTLLSEESSGRGCILLTSQGSGGVRSQSFYEGYKEDSSEQE